MSLWDEIQSQPRVLADFLGQALPALDQGAADLAAERFHVGHASQNRPLPGDRPTRGNTLRQRSFAPAFRMPGPRFHPARTRPTMSSP